jgi:hypothetical protein
VKSDRITWTTQEARHIKLKFWSMHLAWAAADEGVSKTALRLALVLRDRFHSKTGACWARQDQLARAAGFTSTRRVREAIDNLVGKGFLVYQWEYPPDWRSGPKLKILFPATPRPYQPADIPPLDDDEEQGVTGGMPADPSGGMSPYIIRERYKTDLRGVTDEPPSPVPTREGYRSTGSPAPYPELDDEILPWDR